MNVLLRRNLAALLVFSLLLFTAKPAHADSLQNAAIAAAVGIAAVGAAIGVGIYYVARRAPSITGCVASSGDHLQILNEGDQKTYGLIGDTALIHSGDRVRVSGKKKKDEAKNRQFLVEKLSKDFGSCKAVIP